ncbi:MAG: hypothetical protein R2681_06585 [Pyrinomonadaceae bacterium]
MIAKELSQFTNLPHKLKGERKPNQPVETNELNLYQTGGWLSVPWEHQS